VGKTANIALGALEFAAGAVLTFTGNSEFGVPLLAAGATSLAAAFVPAPTAPDVTAQASGNRHTFRAAVTTQKVIYGEVRVSGPLYELGTTNLATPNITAGTGMFGTALVAANAAAATPNAYLHVIVPLAGHQLESIGNVLINGQLVDGVGADPKWSAVVRVNRHLGGATQVADPDLMAELVDANGNKIWDATHIGAEIAYVYIRLKYDKTLFPNGLQDIQCDVLGKLVFDPRTSTTAYSNNWALCVRDYLTSPLGLSMSATDIDDTYIIGAANISDELVATTGGTTQARYTVNGMVDTGNKPTDNIKALLTAGAGYIVPLVEGKLQLIPGAYATPTISLTENDLRGDAVYKEHANRKDLFNTVTGVYAGPETDWQLLSYPQVGLQSAVTADGEEIRKDIALPYCTDNERCQRIAYLVLQQHRAGGYLTLQCKSTALEVTTMDVVSVTLPSLNLVNTSFRVTSWKLNKDLTVDLVLQKDSAALYSWSTTLATPFVPAPPVTPAVPAAVGATAIPVIVNGLQLTGLGASTEFTGPDASFSWRHTTATDFNGLATPPFGTAAGAFAAWFMGYDITILSGATVIFTDFTTANTYVFPFAVNSAIAAGPYRAFTIEVRIKGTGGQLTAPATLSVNNPAPAVPTGLSLTASFTTGWLSFTPPTDLDYAGTVVYMSTTPGFVPSAVNQFADVTATNVVSLTGLLSGAQYFVRVESYDMFGKVGLNISTELSVTTATITAANTDKTPPSVPVVDPLTSIIDTTTMIPTTVIAVSWAASTDNGLLSGYEVQWFDNINTAPVIAFTSSLQHVIAPAVAGRTYTVQVRAVDWASNKSAFSVAQTIIAAGNTVAPMLPTGLTAVAGLDKITYTWTNPADPSFMQANLYITTVAGVTAIPANLHYSGMGNSYVLQVVAGTTYYAAVSSVSSSGVESALSVEVGPTTGVIMTAANTPNYIANQAIGNAQIQAIDAGKITTGVLNAALIGAGTITSDKLFATTLSAISANLGTVTAGTLIGAFLSTAWYGARVSLDSFNGLIAYNVANVPTAQIRTDGSGFIGNAGGLSWDAAGNVTVPGSLVAGTLIGNVIKTGNTGFRVEIGPVQSGATVYLLRYHNGAGVTPFSFDDAGNAVFSGTLSAATGTFSGTLNAAGGTFTGSISAGQITSGTITASLTSTGSLDLTGAGKKFLVRGRDLVETARIVPAGSGNLTQGRSANYYAYGPSRLLIIAKVTVGTTGGNGGVTLYVNGTARDFVAFQNATGSALATTIVATATHTTTAAGNVLLEARAIVGGAYFLYNNISFTVTETKL